MAAPLAPCARAIRVPAAEPRYRFELRVPEGQFDDERRQAMAEEITEAVLDAKGG